MSNCGPTCGPLCRSDTLVKWLAHYGNVPVCWAGPHYGTARPLATHIREDEDGFTPACEAHRRLTVLKEHPMTNEDQLRVIRERLAAITPRHITANPMQWQQDGNYLLQLVTEQQREIERYRRALEAVNEFAKEDDICTHKTIGAQHGWGACFVCLIQATAQGALRGENGFFGEDDEPEAKGYRKQERPM